MSCDALPQRNFLITCGDGCEFLSVTACCRSVSFLAEFYYTLTGDFPKNKDEFLLTQVFVAWLCQCKGCVEHFHTEDDHDFSEHRPGDDGAGPGDRSDP